MISSSDVPSGPGAAQDMALPRLFNLDLPRLKQTGQPLPEQNAAASFHQLLDIASGSGEWALMAALAAPDMQIVGIESDAQLLSQAQVQAHGVENVRFTAMNPFQGL